MYAQRGVQWILHFARRSENLLQLYKCVQTWCPVVRSIMSSQYPVITERVLCLFHNNDYNLQLKWFIAVEGLRLLGNFLIYVKIS